MVNWVHIFGVSWIHGRHLNTICNTICTGRKGREGRGGNGSSSPMFSGLITENYPCQPKNIAMWQVSLVTQVGQRDGNPELCTHSAMTEKGDFLSHSFSGLTFKKFSSDCVIQYTPNSSHCWLSHAISLTDVEETSLSTTLVPGTACATSSALELFQNSKQKMLAYVF